MAKKLMTWVPVSRRWMKRYNGKLYAISCKQLGVPETKEDSFRAANEWWIEKEKEILLDARTAKEREASAVLTQARNQIMAGADVENSLTSVAVNLLYKERADVEKVVREAVEKAGKILASPNRDGLIAEAMIEKSRVVTACLETVMNGAGKPQPNAQADDLGIDAQVKSWLAFMRAKTNIARHDGGLTIQRYDSYRREIGNFACWLKGQRIASNAPDRASWSPR
jgi:hypothetical protein